MCIGTQYSRAGELIVLFLRGAFLDRVFELIFSDFVQDCFSNLKIVLRWIRTRYIIFSRIRFQTLAVHFR